MPLPEMNNVYVMHKGREVSIAYHKNFGTAGIERSIALIPETSEGWNTTKLRWYANSLNSLIDELIKVRDEIDKSQEDKPSGKGNVTGA
tara:strand:- start:28 stop:294 length:267 start_codon:yes stop_codon:yes gene_type:complete